MSGLQKAIWAVLFALPLTTYLVLPHIFINVAPGVVRQYSGGDWQLLPFEYIILTALFFGLRAWRRRKS
jgi:hypothetical protein